VALRIHHLNCISTCPLGGRLMDRRSGSPFARGALACHCLLVETGRTLVLVDTGLGTRDVDDPRSRLSTFFLALLSPDFRHEMTAVRQVERLGFKAGDVRHILLTHLDFDHAGGLDDFPEAAVHMMAAERDYAVEQKTWLDRQRFRPQQWSTRDNWRSYAAGEGDDWLGFSCVRALEEVPPELLLVPLTGHTFGHAGVAIDTGKGWLLMAGDAYFDRREMHPEPACTPGLRFYQGMMEKDRRARLWNQERLRRLRAERGGEVRIACSHDAGEFEECAGRALREPASDAQAQAVTPRRRATDLHP